MDYEMIGKIVLYLFIVGGVLAVVLYGFLWKRAQLLRDATESLRSVAEGRGMQISDLEKRIKACEDSRAVSEAQLELMEQRIFRQQGKIDTQEREIAAVREQVRHMDEQKQ